MNFPPLGVMLDVQGQRSPAPLADDVYSCVFFNLWLKEKGKSAR